MNRTYDEGISLPILSQRKETGKFNSFSLSPCNQNSFINNSTHWSDILNNFVLWAKFAAWIKKSNKDCYSSNWVFGFFVKYSNFFFSVLLSLSLLFSLLKFSTFALTTPITFPWLAISVARISLIILFLIVL